MARTISAAHPAYPRELRAAGHAVVVLAVIGVAQFVVIPALRATPPERVATSSVPSAIEARIETPDAPERDRDPASVAARLHQRFDVAASFGTDPAPYYQLVHAGRALAVTADDQATLVVPADEVRQHWKLVAHGERYHLTNRIRGERMSLDVFDDRLRLVGTSSAPSQTWTLEVDATGYLLINAAHIDRSLAITNGSVRLAAFGQRWRLNRVQ